MRFIIIFLLLSLLCLRLSAQTAINSETISRVWLIDSGAFPNNIVKLKAYEAATDSSRTYSGYEFLKDGTFRIVNHAANNLAFCGNGAPYLKNGTWGFNKLYIRVKAKGGYFAAGTYSYDLKYKISSFADGLLILRKAKTYKNKRCEVCQDSPANK